MQRIKASEVILVREIKATTSEAASSPAHSKQTISPSKDVEMEVEDNENSNPNYTKEEENKNEVSKRENLFEIRKKKEYSNKNKEEINPKHNLPKKELEVSTQKKNSTPVKEDEEMFDYELTPLNLTEQNSIAYLK